MKKRILTLIVLLMTLSACGSSLKPEVKEPVEQAFTLEQIETKIRNDLDNLTSFYFTEYKDEEMVGTVILDSEGSLAISNDNGMSVWYVDGIGVKNLLARDEFNAEGNYISEYYDFAGFQGNRSDIDLENSKEALEFFYKVYETTQYESLPFEYEEDQDKEKYNYFFEGQDTMEFKGEIITYESMQFYYSPLEYTYGIQFTSKEDDESIKRTFFLTMNDDELIVPNS